MGKPRFKLTKKRLLVTGGIIVLLLGMAGAGMFVWWLQNKDRLPEGNFIMTPEKPMPSAVDEAQSLAIVGKTDEANKKLDEALADGNLSGEVRSQILVQQGVSYGNKGDNAKALERYLEAEKALSTFTTSHLIGEAYEALGDKQKAIDYFKKGIGQLNPSAISYNMDKTYYEDKIKQLGGQP